METALRCRGLVKRFGRVTAVAGLELEVREGECFGLLGPNGAGKTTTLEILEGLVAPDAGVVEVLGEQWGRGRDRQIRESLGVQLQETQLSEKLTVLETLRLFRSFYVRGRGPQEVIALVGLEEKRHARVGKLSGGQRQRLALACALVCDPAVLFLDEPTTGLDPQARHKVWEIVTSFRGQGGTVLLTTHYMEEAARLADRVAIIDHGRIIQEGPPARLVASLGAQQIVELRPGAPVPVAEIERVAGVVGLIVHDGSYLVRVSEIGTALPGLLALLERRGATLESLTTHQPTLEDVFVHLTGRALRDA
jgi:ABC-2 type transport system ATP-binding protein